MEIDVDGDPLGAPAYHPWALLSVWLYGFMTGVRSSRKLEAACRDQIPFLWLTGWQHPDHNTLWRFYQAHRSAMRWLLKHTVRTAVEVGLVDLAVQALDGTKIAANAAGDQTYDMSKLERLLAKTGAAIGDLEAQNEGGDDPPRHGRAYDVVGRWGRPRLASGWRGDIGGPLPASPGLRKFLRREAFLLHGIGLALYRHINRRVA